MAVVKLSVSTSAMAIESESAVAASTTAMRVSAMTVPARRRTIESRREPSRNTTVTLLTSEPTVDAIPSSRY